MSGFAEIVSSRRVIICCGSGGVGKTTTAAAVAVAGALAGRRACVVTIDPARRLADALSEAALGDAPREVDGPWSGSLAAVMLDAKSTFDALVLRYAANKEQAQRILENRIYRNLASVLSGTEEYMATEKLFELQESADYDLVVVDTPPSRHALDFLDAPKRLEGFLDNRLFRSLVAPAGSYLRFAQAASQLLVRSIARVVGAEIVDDTIAFFQAFQGMEMGFRERASRVEALLAEQSTGFVLIAAPRREAVADAGWFAAELARRDQRVDALVINRVVPDFGPPVATDTSGEPNGSGAWGQLTENLAELDRLHQRQAATFAELSETVSPAPTIRVPLFERDVHDLEGLLRIVRHLLD